MKVKDIVQQAFLALLYVVLTAAIPYSFLGLQVRISEFLLFTVLFNRKHAIGLILGCFLANLFFSPLGIIDAVVGTLATALTCLLMMMPQAKVKPVLWILFGVIITSSVAVISGSLDGLKILIAAALTAVLCFAVNRLEDDYVAFLWPALINGIIIGVQINYVFGDSVWLMIVQVFLGELLATFGLALLFWKRLKNSTDLQKLLN